MVPLYRSDIVTCTTGCLESILEKLTLLEEKDGPWILIFTLIARCSLLRSRNFFVCTEISSEFECYIYLFHLGEMGFREQEAAEMCSLSNKIKVDTIMLFEPQLH